MDILRSIHLSLHLEKCMIEIILGITFLIVIVVVWKGISCLKNHSETLED
jgi:hypothetical protein